MTRDQLRKLCVEWQQRLRLQDWDVHAYVARHWEMGDGRLGECEYVLHKKQAVIRVLDPKDVIPNPAWPHDPERTLIHELLHLHFAPFGADPDTPADIAQEQAIHLLAGALVRLKREAVTTTSAESGARSRSNGR